MCGRGDAARALERGGDGAAPPRRRRRRGSRSSTRCGSASRASTSTICRKCSSSRSRTTSRPSCRLPAAAAAKDADAAPAVTLSDALLLLPPDWRSAARSSATCDAHDARLARLSEPPRLASIAAARRPRRVRTLLAQAATRGILLLGAPVVLQLALLRVHLAYLPRSGNGDNYLSRAFQTPLDGNAHAARVAVDARPGFFATAAEHLAAQVHYNRNMAVLFPRGSHAFDSPWHTWPLAWRGVYFGLVRDWRAVAAAPGGRHLLGFLLHPNPAIALGRRRPPRSAPSRLASAAAPRGGSSACAGWRPLCTGAPARSRRLSPPLAAVRDAGAADLHPVLPPRLLLCDPPRRPRMAPHRLRAPAADRCGGAHRRARRRRCRLVAHRRARRRRAGDGRRTALRLASTECWFGGRAPSAQRRKTAPLNRFVYGLVRVQALNLVDHVVHLHLRRRRLCRRRRERPRRPVISEGGRQLLRRELRRRQRRLVRGRFGTPLL